MSSRRPCAPQGDDAPVYLSLHGGALILGGGDLTRVMTQIGAMSTPVVHWAPDYRMPPLHPYPAALDDVVAVYRALLEVRDPSQIVVGGGSAGRGPSLPRSCCGRRPKVCRCRQPSCS